MTKQTSLPTGTKAVVAIVCITVVLAAGLIAGHNGTLLAGGIAVIAGLGGYVTGKAS